MSEALPRRRGASVVTGYAAVALLGLAACAPAKPKTAPSPLTDPRVGLKAGLFDAGEAISNMKVVAKAVSPPGFLGITNSDLAFMGKFCFTSRALCNMEFNNLHLWRLDIAFNEQNK